MADYRKLLNQAKIVIDDLGKLANSDEAYCLYTSMINKHWENSDQTDRDKADYVADFSYLLLSYKSHVLSEYNPKFKHLPKLITTSKGVIKGLTDTAFETITHPSKEQNINKRLDDLADNIKYHYKREYNKVAEPTRKIWKAIHDIFEEYDLGFHTEY